jgi:hypothetical protein
MRCPYRPEHPPLSRDSGAAIGSSHDENGCAASRYLHGSPLALRRRCCSSPPCAVPRLSKYRLDGDSHHHAAACRVCSDLSDGCLDRSRMVREPAGCFQLITVAPGSEGKGKATTEYFCVLFQPDGALSPQCFKCYFPNGNWTRSRQDAGVSHCWVAAVASTVVAYTAAQLTGSWEGDRVQLRTSSLNMLHNNRLQFASPFRGGIPVQNPSAGKRQLISSAFLISTLR